MTLDEAISHAREKAEQLKDHASKWKHSSEECESQFVREKASEKCKECLECATEHEQLADWLEELKARREADKWIKITYRPMTKEEEISYKREFGIDYGVTLLECESSVFTCELPQDKQDILIQTKWGVKQDTCDWSDGYCGLKENGDWDGVIAWRPTPEYKESEAENE